MEPNGAFNERISCFLEAWAALPSPREVSSELVIISTGAVRGNWSFKHVFTTGETYNFIFRKADLLDFNAPWECADRELDALVRGVLTQTEKI